MPVTLIAKIKQQAGTFKLVDSVDINTGATYTEADGTLNGATEVTLIPAPASGLVRVIRELNVQNRDTVTQGIILRYVSPGGTRQLWAGSVRSGETISWDKPLVLDTTGKSIRAVMLTGAVTTNPDFTVAWEETTNLAPAVFGANDGTLNGTTAVTLIAAPAASTQRSVRSITFQNRDTSPTTITLRMVSGANTRQMWLGTIPPGGTALWDRPVFCDATNKSITAVMAAAPATTQPDFTACWGDYS